MSNRLQNFALQKNAFENPGGFTLIEILVAIIVLSIGLLGMATLTGTIIHGNKLSNDLTTATTLAQDKIEELRSGGYDGLPSSDNTDPEDYGDITGYPEYKRKTKTEVDEPATNMKTVTVTVFWYKHEDVDEQQDEEHPEHEVVLKTIVSQ